jgi:hypothetical protein
MLVTFFITSNQLSGHTFSMPVYPGAPTVRKPSLAADLPTSGCLLKLVQGQARC